MVLTKNKEIEQYCPYLSSTFLQIYDTYTVKRFKKEQTISQYLYAIAALCNEEKCDFLDLTKDNVITFFKKFQQNSDPATVKYNLRIYKALARYLDANAENYGIHPIYADLFTNLQIEEPDIQIEPEDLPEFSEIDKVFHYVSEKKQMVLFLAMTLALRCSMTIHEMTNLKKEMFLQDANGNYGIRIPVSNTTDRFIKIPDDVAEIIKTYTLERINTSPYLLLNKQGRPISKRSLQSWLRDACITCHIKPFTLNHLRALSVAHMLKSGAPSKKVAEYIDLKNVDWFFRYDRVINELKDSAVDYTHIRIIE